MNAELKPIQTGGMCHAWRSPDGSFKHVLLKLDLRCEPDNYPGIVIIADEGCRQAVATSVKSLRKELPKLLEAAAATPVVYWRIERDAREIERILSGLTEHPMFVG